MRRNTRVLVVFAFLAVLLACVGALSLYELYAGPGPLLTAATVIVPKGATVAEIGQLLERSDVLSSALMFRLSARMERSAVVLRAGEYRFEAGTSMRDVLATLRAGETVSRRLTVPEGMTSRQVVAMLWDAEGLEGEVVAPPVEGALLPETYNYSWGDSRPELIRRMSSAMAATLDELWIGRDPGLPLASTREALILASIVEKETGLAEERPRVAAVFINRLRLGMKLQADPTVAYAMQANTGDGGRLLTLADLQYPSPYNTYVVEGLPPGPIANPGRAALEAVLRPSRTDELFFCADGSGGHAFARTLDEHQRNVARWRKLNERAEVP